MFAEITHSNSSEVVSRQPDFMTRPEDTIHRGHHLKMKPSDIATDLPQRQEAIALS